MLKAAGVEPFRHLNVHGYWNMDQAKISKSLGNVVRPQDLTNRFGPDAVRYFFLREMVFGLDAQFSEEALIQRINADLANNLGNCVSRSLTLIEKFHQGTIPFAENGGPDEEILKEINRRTWETVRVETPKLAFHKALMALWEYVDALNKYIDTQAPWALAKDPARRPRLLTVLNALGETLYQLALLLRPFLPRTSDRILEQLGEEEKDFPSRWPEEPSWGGQVGGKKIRKGPALFPRIETDKKKERVLVKGPKGEPAPSPSLTLLPIEEFQKWDLRVAKILSAERVPKSDKLIKLEVDLGEKRTVVAGIGKDYSPESLIGKSVVVVANLEPATLMGVESRAMLLAARDEKGLHLIIPEVETRPGAPVK